METELLSNSRKISRHIFKTPTQVKKEIYIKKSTIDRLIEKRTSGYDKHKQVFKKLLTKIFNNFSENQMKSKGKIKSKGKKDIIDTLNEEFLDSKEKLSKFITLGKDSHFYQLFKKYKDNKNYEGKLLGFKNNLTKMDISIMDRLLDKNTASPKLDSINKKSSNIKTPNSSLKINNNSNKTKIINFHYDSLTGATTEKSNIINTTDEYNEISIKNSSIDYLTTRNTFKNHSNERLKQKEDIHSRKNSTDKYISITEFNENNNTKSTCNTRKNLSKIASCNSIFNNNIKSKSRSNLNILNLPNVSSSLLVPIKENSVVNENIRTPLYTSKQSTFKLDSKKSSLNIIKLNKNPIKSSNLKTGNIDFLTNDSKQHHASSNISVKMGSNTNLYLLNDFKRNHGKLTQKTSSNIVNFLKLGDKLVKKQARALKNQSRMNNILFRSFYLTQNLTNSDAVSNISNLNENRFKSYQDNLKLDNIQEDEDYTNKKYFMTEETNNQKIDTFITNLNSICIQYDFVESNHKSSPIKTGHNKYFNYNNLKRVIELNRLTKNIKTNSIFSQSLEEDRMQNTFNINDFRKVKLASKVEGQIADFLKKKQKKLKMPSNIKSSFRAKTNDKYKEYSGVHLGKK